MPTDFYTAARRHHKDAGILLSAQRLANASQLFGLAAECGLKTLMEKFGMSIDGQGKPSDRLDQVHADKIWQRYAIYQGGSYLAANYVLGIADPFTGWQIAQRYMDDACVSQASVATHEAGAQEVMRLLRQAYQDGVLP